MKIIEIKEQMQELRNRAQAIVEVAKKEVRDLTEDEEKEIEEIKSEIDEKKDEIKELQNELDEKIKELEENSEVEDEETKSEDCDEKDENTRAKKYLKRNKMKKQSLVKEIRNALNDNKKSITINAETRTVQVQGAEGVHDQVIETEIEGILEPLYANSVLAQLGARWYSGLPMGDVQIPVMGKSTVNWEGEIDEAQATGNTFTTVKLQPKRLSAYIDISKQLLAQDTIGVENAIRRDIVNALKDKLEATLFGEDAGDTEKPAGLFNGATIVTVDDYAKLCDFEADVEEANVYGNMKYVLSPKAKATFRQMIKGTNNTGMVYENGEMEGISTYVTSNVPSKKFVYGNFENLVIGSWGDIELVFDPYTQATKGTVRIVINAYFDFKPARDVAFAFGTVGE